MTASLASRTLERASLALRSGEAACLPEIVKLVRTLSRGTDAVSVADLAEVVQADPVVLAKVIGAANTLAYNPHGAAVSTVHQAIHVIGYERIRNLAMSLMLMEHTSRHRAAAEQQEATALALTSGFIAQAAAESRLLIDAERAFVCASLRNFGRIILSTFMIEEYRSAQALAGDEPDDEAFRQVFGLTPLELGRHLLEASDLPEPILSALREWSTEALEVLKITPDAQVLALTDFSARLAQLAFDSRLTAREFEAATSSLVTRYGHVLPGLEDEVVALLAKSEEQLGRLMHTFKLSAIPAQTRLRLRQRVKRVDPLASTKVKPAVQTSHAAPSTALAPTTASLSGKPTLAPVAVWEHEESVFTQLAEREGSLKVVLDALLVIAQRGFGTSECLLFIRAGNDPVASRFKGTGARLSQVGREVRVAADERTAFGISLSRGENVLLHHAADPKIAPYLPAWLKRCEGLGAFALLPVLEERPARGLLLVGWSGQHHVIIPAEQAQIIRRLLAVAARAVARLTRSP